MVEKVFMFTIHFLKQKLPADSVSGRTCISPPKSTVLPKVLRKPIALSDGEIANS